MKARRCSLPAARPMTPDPDLKPYRRVVAALLDARRPGTIRDAPSGAGWLAAAVEYPATVDGIDLYAEAAPGYRHFARHDMILGLPDRPGAYGCAVMSEVLAALGNPGPLFAPARRTLRPRGLLVPSTPDTWHPAARVQFLLRGFFPGYPAYAGRIHPGSTSMHLLHWSWPQLHLFLGLAGFDHIRLQDVAERKPRRPREKHPRAGCSVSTAAGACAGPRRRRKPISGRRRASPRGIHGRLLGLSATAPG